MKTIFDKTTIKGKILKNRIFRSATWMGLADNNGNLTNELIHVYKKLAKGGVGTIITGITSISPVDMYLKGQVRLISDDQIPQHKKFTDIIHNYDTKILVQAAITSSCRDDGFIHEVMIDELSTTEVEEYVLLFKEAAIRIEKAGYDGIQIHAAHGFFLSSFISPLYNHREDEYGGNNIKRAKILVDIIKEIKNVVADDFLITIKINSTDVDLGGLTEDDFILVSKKIADAGIDLIEVSANYTSRPVNDISDEAYFKESAIRLSKEVNIPIILVGGNRHVDRMNQLLNETKIDYLSMSRPLIREPDLINKWINSKTKDSLCISCNNCYRTPHHECIFNMEK